jgi:hypothetical protein
MACWAADLQAAVPGVYHFETYSNGGSRIFIDGKPVLENRHADGPPRAERGQIELRPGTHRFELQYFWSRDHGYLEVYWTPPGGERAMIGPDALSVKGGLWLPGPVAEPASPPSRAFAAP